MRNCRTYFFAPFLILSLVILSIDSVSADDHLPQSITFADFGYINSVASSLNRVYFATTEGIIRFNKQNDSWDEPLTGSAAIQNQEILRVWVDSFDEKLYAETVAGFYEYDIFFGVWFPISHFSDLNSNYSHTKPPEDLLPEMGEIYFGGGSFEDSLGRRYSISDMILDESGNYWIGTWGNGAARASITSRVVERLPFGLTQNRVGTIYSEDSLLWLGGRFHSQRRSGITGFDPNTFRSIQIESGVTNGFPAANINCLIGDDDYLYLGTDEGLMLMDRSSFRIMRQIERRHGLIDDKVTSLAAVGDTLFVGTQGGLSIITHEYDSIAAVYPEQFFNHTIYDIEHIGGHIWIASSVGAFRLSLKTFKLQSYIDKDALLFSHVYDIFGEGDNIWFAADGGLLRLNRNSGKSQKFQDQSSLPFPRVVAANEYLAAISSSRGVLIFFLNDDDFRTSREFSIEDGLASSEVSSLFLSGDYLWIGTDKGLTRLLWNDDDFMD